MTGECGTNSLGKGFGVCALTTTGECGTQTRGVWARGWEWGGKGVGGRVKRSRRRKSRVGCGHLASENELRPEPAQMQRTWLKRYDATSGAGGKGYNATRKGYNATRGREGVIVEGGGEEQATLPLQRSLPLRESFPGGGERRSSSG
jgi:hypothetical protein